MLKSGICHNLLNLHWRPIYEMMECAEIDIESLYDEEGKVPQEQVDESYSIGTEYLKSRVSYIFDNPRLIPKCWAISTWPKKV